MCRCDHESAVEEYEFKGFTVRILRDNDPENPREGWDNVGKMVCWHSRYKLGDEHSFEEPRQFWADLFNGIELSDEEIRQFLLMIVGSDWGREDYYNTIWNLRKFGNKEMTKLDRRRFYVDAFVSEEWDSMSDSLMEFVRDKVTDHCVVLPLYLYDHSGITMRTSQFACKWDSGQVGFIYISLKDAAENWQCEPDWSTEVHHEHDKTTKTLRERAADMLNGEVKVYDQYLTGQVYGYEIQDEDGIELNSCWGFFDDYDLKYVKSEAESIVDWHHKQGGNDFQI